VTVSRLDSKKNRPVVAAIRRWPTRFATGSVASVGAARTRNDSQGTADMNLHPEEGTYSQAGDWLMAAGHLDPSVSSQTLCGFVTAAV
jgi:hypothetical protein